jgi:hypothetical protein
VDANPQIKTLQKNTSEQKLIPTQHQDKINQAQKAPHSKEIN